jgi:hypothetical protein
MGERTARLSPISIRISAQVRLARLYPKAIFKEDAGQLILPLPASVNPAVALAGALAELVPD